MADTVGAQAVADAVKKVADAAVASVAGAPAQATPRRDFTFGGSSTGGFTIRGNGFTASGTVKVNGIQAQTTEWGNEFIKGKMPEGVKAGTVTVEVIIDDKTSQRGTYTL